jgi:hypothetical protein
MTDLDSLIAFFHNASGDLRKIMGQLYRVIGNTIIADSMGGYTHAVQVHHEFKARFSGPDRIVIPLLCAFRCAHLFLPSHCTQDINVEFTLT